MRRRWLLASLVGLAALTAACVPVAPGPPAPLAPPPPDITPSSPPANWPDISGAHTNKTFITGLGNPWDVAFTPDGTTGLFTERVGRITSFNPSTGATKVVGTIGDTYASGESGLLGLAPDPAFTTNHYLYVCVSSATSGKNEIRRYTVDLSAAPNAGLSGQTIMLTGMPLASFHDGCRVRFQPNTNPPALWVTMGDAGLGPGPQDWTSPAGKILRTRVDQGTLLEPYPGNTWQQFSKPWSLVYSYGHRNPQGLAFNPNLFDNGAPWPYDSEHGPNINDEVNKLFNAGNAGWDPNTNGSYDQTHPMTDVNKFPNAVRPVWRSGDGGTFAPSGATFIQNVGSTDWKSWNGALAVAFLKDSKVRLMFMDAQGNVTGTARILENGVRLRSVTEGPDGSLYISTDAGAPNDAIWKITPG